MTSIGSWRQLGRIIKAHEPGQRAAGWVKPALKLLPRALLAAAAQQVVPVSLENLRTDNVDPVGRLGGVRRHVVPRVVEEVAGRGRGHRGGGQERFLSSATLWLGGYL